MIANFTDIALLVIDMQEKLLDCMDPKVVEQLLRNQEILIELVLEEGGSVFYTEQYPKGLGGTHPRLKKLLGNCQRIEKMSFSCLGESDFCERVVPYLPSSLIVVGVEAHICVLSTVFDLLLEDEEEEREIFVPIDCVASRSKQNWKNALDQMRMVGIYTTNTETLVYQGLEEAGSEKFKKYSKLLR